MGGCGLAAPLPLGVSELISLRNLILSVRASLMTFICYWKQTNINKQTHTKEDLCGKEQHNTSDKSN